LPFLDEMLVKSNIPLSDDNRCEALCTPMGIVGASFNGLKQVFAEGKEKSIHLIEYNDLINSPEDTMRKIYDFLGETYFAHDFNKLENIHRERDSEIYGLADMHEVRRTLNKVSINPQEVLSENILEKCKGSEFWRNMYMNEESPDSTEMKYLDDFDIPSKELTEEHKFIG